MIAPIATWDARAAWDSDCDDGICAEIQIDAGDPPINASADYWDVAGDVKNSETLSLTQTGTTNSSIGGNVYNGTVDGINLDPLNNGDAVTISLDFSTLTIGGDVINVASDISNNPSMLINIRDGGFLTVNGDFYSGTFSNFVQAKDTAITQINAGSGSQLIFQNIANYGFEFNIISGGSLEIASVSNGYGSMELQGNDNIHVAGDVVNLGTSLILSSIGMSNSSILIDGYVENSAGNLLINSDNGIVVGDYVSVDNGSTTILSLNAVPGTNREISIGGGLVIDSGDVSISNLSDGAIRIDGNVLIANSGLLSFDSSGDIFVGGIDIDATSHVNIHAGEIGNMIVDALGVLDIAGNLNLNGTEEGNGSLNILDSKTFTVTHSGADNIIVAGSINIADTYSLILSGGGFQSNNISNMGSFSADGASGSYNGTAKISDMISSNGSATDSFVLQDFALIEIGMDPGAGLVSIENLSGSMILSTSSGSINIGYDVVNSANISMVGDNISMGGDLNNSNKFGVDGLVWSVSGDVNNTGYMLSGNDNVYAAGDEISVLNSTTITGDLNLSGANTVFALRTGTFSAGNLSTLFQSNIKTFVLNLTNDEINTGNIYNGTTDLVAFNLNSDMYLTADILVASGDVINTGNILNMSASLNPVFIGGNLYSGTIDGINKILGNNSITTINSIDSIRVEKDIVNFGAQMDITSVPGAFSVFGSVINNSVLNVSANVIQFGANGSASSVENNVGAMMVVDSATYILLAGSAGLINSGDLTMTANEGFISVSDGALLNNAGAELIFVSQKAAGGAEIILQSVSNKGVLTFSSGLVSVKEHVENLFGAVQTINAEDSFVFGNGGPSYLDNAGTFTLNMGIYGAGVFNGYFENSGVASLSFNSLMVFGDMDNSGLMTLDFLGTNGYLEIYDDMNISDSVDSKIVVVGASGAKMKIFGDANIGGDLISLATADSANGSLNIRINGFELSSDSNIIIDGDILTSQALSIITDQLTGTISGGDWTNNGAGNVSLTSTSASFLDVVNNAVMSWDLADIATVNSFNSASGKLDLTGTALNSDSDINLSGSIVMDGTNTATGGGINILSALYSITSISGDIVLDSIVVDSGMDLSVGAENIIVNGYIDNAGTLDMIANDTIDVTGNSINSGTAGWSAESINFAGILRNSGTMTLVSSIDTFVNHLITDAGTTSQLNLDTYILDGNNVSVAGLRAGDISIAGEIINDGSTTNYGGSANVFRDNFTFITTGAFQTQGGIVNSQTLTIDSGATVTIADGITNNSDLFIKTVGNTVISGVSVNNAGSNLMVDAGAASVFFGNLTNLSSASIILDGGTMQFGNVVNSGEMDWNAVSVVSVSSLKTNQNADSQLNITGTKLVSSYLFDVGGNLIYGAVSDFNSAGSVNILNTYNYTIVADSINVDGDITQASKTLTIDSKNVTVNGGLNRLSGNMIFKSSYAYYDGIGLNNGLNVSVGTDVSEGVKFNQLTSLNIGGNYIFNDVSALNIAVDDLTRTTPYVTVGGDFITNLTNGNNGRQISISLFDVLNLDANSEITLIHVDGDITELGDSVMRFLNVYFCNLTGTQCVDLASTTNASGDLNPQDIVSGPDNDFAYIYYLLGDHDIKIVFDPDKSPAKIQEIQPIVEVSDSPTSNDVQTAGAMDSLIEMGLINGGWNPDFSHNYLPVITTLLPNSPFSGIMQELYPLLQNYELDNNPDPIRDFVSLFNIRGAEQIAHSISLSNRNMASTVSGQIMDTFLWKRNINRNNLWADLSYSMISLDGISYGSPDGNMLTGLAGFDRRINRNLIFGGFMGGARNDMEIKINNPKTTDTSVHFGVYGIMGRKEAVKLYGNLMVSLHEFDIEREQQYVGHLSGSGSAFGVSTEWGIVHKIWGVYAAGRGYIRAGYYSGYDYTEQESDNDYMVVEQDAYVSITPGYEATLGKNIYITRMSYLRPFIGLGIEYDVMGMDNLDTSFHFAGTNGNFDYSGVSSDGFWMNARAGVEFAHAYGTSVNVSYEYHYNADAVVNTLRVGAEFRF